MRGFRNWQLRLVIFHPRISLLSLNQMGFNQNYLGGNFTTKWLRSVDNDVSLEV